MSIKLYRGLDTLGRNNVMLRCPLERDWVSLYNLRLGRLLALCIVATLLSMIVIISVEHYRLNCFWLSTLMYCTLSLGFCCESRLLIRDIFLGAQEAGFKKYLEAIRLEPESRTKVAFYELIQIQRQIHQLTLQRKKSEIATDAELKAQIDSILEDLYRAEKEALRTYKEIASERVKKEAREVLTSVNAQRRGSLLTVPTDPEPEPDKLLRAISAESQQVQPARLDILA